MVISAEVIERKRPATLTWVEQMLRKHGDLPTNRLLLVSKSGFSANALSLIETEAGRVEALSPELVEVGGSAVVKRLYVDNVNYSPTRCIAHVQSGGERIAVEGEPLTDVYAADGTLLGPLSNLVQDAVNLEPVRHGLFVEAHKHPEKDKVKRFSLGFAMPQLGYHLKRVETGELHPSRRWRFGGTSRCTRRRSRSPSPNWGDAPTPPPKPRLLAAPRCGSEPPTTPHKPRRSPGRRRTQPARRNRRSSFRSGRFTFGACSTFSLCHRAAGPTRRPPPPA
jgi:hypothetical protein